jgi:hypothetical protein
MPNNPFEAPPIELQLAEALNPNLETPPAQRKFGNQPDIRKNNVTVRIGSTPIVIDLVQIYQRSGRQLPADLAFFADSYRMWMIQYHVNAMEEPGRDRIRQLGFEVRLPEGERHPEFTVVSVLPQTAFVTRLQVDGRLECSADLDLSAGAKLPGAVTELVKELDVGAELGGAAKFQVSSGAKIAGRISFAVVTATIAAIGEGDTYSQWVLQREDRPLTGGHCFVQVALVPEVVKQVSVECRVSAVVTSAFGLFPDKRRSGWTKLRCRYPAKSQSGS